MDSLATFASSFREQAFSGLEYSFGTLAMRSSMTVPGKPGFEARLSRLCVDLSFTKDWAWSIRQFTNLVRPDAYLLRIDSRSEQIEALTLYCRFPVEPDDTAFQISATYMAPFEWKGTSPSALASVLRVRGPRGIGLRVTSTGELSTALYFAVSSERSDFAPAALSRLLELCCLPAYLNERIQEDMRELYPPGAVGIIGIDSAKAGRGNVIKFNPPNVPLDRAFQFLRKKRAAETRLIQIADTARFLRAIWASYLGCKYSANGFEDWRLYFSTQPYQIPGPTELRITREKISRPTIRLPHY